MKILETGTGKLILGLILLSVGSLLVAIAIHVPELLGYEYIFEIKDAMTGIKAWTGILLSGVLGIISIIAGVILITIGAGQSLTPSSPHKTEKEEAE